MTRHQGDTPAAEVAEHLSECLPVDAAIVVDGSADQIVSRLLAAGWTLNPYAEVIAGKRIRTMRPPPGKDITR